MCNRFARFSNSPILRPVPCIRIRLARSRRGGEEVVCEATIDTDQPDRHLRLSPQIVESFPKFLQARITFIPRQSIRHHGPLCRVNRRGRSRTRSASRILCHCTGPLYFMDLGLEELQLLLRGFAVGQMSETARSKDSTSHGTGHMRTTVAECNDNTTLTCMQVLACSGTRCTKQGRY